MTKQDKAKSINRMNQHFIEKYQGLKAIALRHGDQDFAAKCDKWIQAYQGGITRWSY